MTYGCYWITQSLDNVQAEIGDDENEGQGGNEHGE
jgi:hypothetical protein